MAKSRSSWSWHSEGLEVTSIQNSPWSQENSKQAIYAEVLPSIDTYNLPCQPQAQASPSQVGTHSRALRLSPNQAQTVPSGEKAPEQMKPLPEIFLMPWVISVKQHVPTCGIKLGAQLWHKHDLSQQKDVTHGSTVTKEGSQMWNITGSWWRHRLNKVCRNLNKVCRWGRWDGKWWHAQTGWCYCCNGVAQTDKHLNYPRFLHQEQKNVECFQGWKSKDTHKIRKDLVISVWNMSSQQKTSKKAFPEWVTSTSAQRKECSSGAGKERWFLPDYTYDWWGNYGSSACHSYLCTPERMLTNWEIW